MSTGVSSILPLINADSADLLREADQAKQAGRNCVKSKGSSIIVLESGNYKPK